MLLFHVKCVNVQAISREENKISPSAYCCLSLKIHMRHATLLILRSVAKHNRTTHIYRVKVMFRASSGIADCILRTIYTLILKEGNGSAEISWYFVQYSSS